MQAETDNQTPNTAVDTDATATDAETTAPDSAVIETATQELTERVDGFINGLPGPIADAWMFIQQYPLATTLLIFFFGIFAARANVWLINRSLSQVTKRTRSTTDDKLLAMSLRPVFVTTLLFFTVLSLRPVAAGSTFYQVFGNLMASLVIMTWLSTLMPASKIVLETLGRNSKRFPIIEERTIPLFNIISILILFGLSAYVLLILWGINPTAWLASAGVLGIAVGFAARDTLANLFSGIFIVADSPYHIGDYINLDSGERGKVTSVGLRSTRLLTRDDIEITIPNAVIANAKIINESGGPYEKSRIRIKVGVAYGTDLDNLVSVLEDIANEYPQIAKSPTPRVRMRGFGDSSLDFELLCWIDAPVLRGKVSHDLYMLIHDRFAEENIEIPFPQRDLYVKTIPPVRQDS